MKQLLLRVDDELHAELATQAAALGRSVNSLANEVLVAALRSPAASRRDRLNQRLSTLKVADLRWGDLPLAERPQAISEMQGVGHVADVAIDAERDAR